MKQDSIQIEYTNPGRLSRAIGADAVSFTGNAAGFTPLAVVAGEYDFDPKLLAKASSAAAERGEICILKKLSPTAFIVPRTQGRKKSLTLVTDLMDAIEAEAVSCLHFAHFFFLLSFPEEELRIILEHIRNREFTHLKRLIIAVDKSFEAQFERLLYSIFTDGTRGTDQENK